MKDAKERIEKLKKEIDRQRYLYHVLDTQEISDAALDSLKHELTELEKRYPEFATLDSPSQRVAGKPLDTFKKVTHSKPVLSLEDAFSFNDLREWEKRNQKLLDVSIKGYYCELKFDGLSVVLTYRDGLFVRGATRGDGRIGEDVTHNLKTIESIPLKLTVKGFKHLPSLLEFRGEAVMSKKAFEALNHEQQKKGLPLYANPRNVSAGSIRQLDPAISASRKLDCFIFELITDVGQKTHAESHEIMQQLGFKTSPYNQEVKTLSQVRDYLSHWEKRREKIPYNTDGAVIIVNDSAQERYLGSVGKSERWMIAYKFAAEQGTTKVKAIRIQVGRTGALTPVALLEPVQLAGTTVSRATLHNEDEIKRLDVRIGDTVIVEKAGDIIPDVIQVLKKLRTGKEKPFRFPTKCPVCGSPVVRPAGEVAHYCTNKRCFAQELERLIHFVGKKGFDMVGLGEKIVAQLVNEGLVHDAADFFTLKKGDLLPLARFAEISAEKLVDAIANSREIALDRFIYALGIRHVGEETARRLASHFHAIERLRIAIAEELNGVPDVGETVAQSIVDWFGDARNQRFLDNLFRRGVRPKPVRALLSSKQFAGKTFVITGTLSQSRDTIANRIRSLGGSVSSSVSAKTSFVVVGENPGSKFERAQALHVPTLTEAELEKMLS